MPWSRRSRSSVGSTSTATLPLKEISPTSTSSSTWSTNSRAASLAASSRVGATSVAIIDSDTSNSSMMRPSLSVRSVVADTGRAMATTPAVRPSSMRAAMTWRRQPGRDGATRSSRSTWVKRTVARRPHSWVAT